MFVIPDRIHMMMWMFFGLDCLSITNSGHCEEHEMNLLCSLVVENMKIEKNVLVLLTFVRIKNGHGTIMFPWDSDPQLPQVTRNT